MEEKGSGERKGSTIPQGVERGEGIAAEGPTVVENSEGEESFQQQRVYSS